MSVVANIHSNLKVGNEYLQSTYLLDNGLLHGSFFAFESEPHYSNNNTKGRSPYSSPSKKMKTQSLKGNGEKTWWNRAIIVYFKLHKQLGNNSVDFTASVFGMKRSTIATWLTNKDYINTWVHLLPELSFDEVVQSIPKDSMYFHKYKYMKETTYYREQFNITVNLIKKKRTTVQSTLFFQKNDSSPQKLTCIPKKTHMDIT